MRYRKFTSAFISVRFSDTIRFRIGNVPSSEKVVDVLDLKKKQ